MKIRLLSDLHLEFRPDRYLEIPEGEVLILAGDICLVDEIGEMDKFFNQCVAKYDKVYYVMGNHEFYHSSFKDAHSRLKSALPKGIRLLQNQSEYYNGVHFVGATMWTDFNNDGLEIESARHYMNDYYTIGGFTPEKSIEENTNTKEWFNQCVPMLKQAPVVMITHHSPSESSVKGRYLQSKSAYSNRMEKFITDHSNISHWVHGHIHHNNDYKIGGCRVLSNPRGYDPVELNPSFDISYEFEITHQECLSFRG